MSSALRAMRHLHALSSDGRGGAALSSIWFCLSGVGLSFGIMMLFMRPVVAVHFSAKRVLERAFDVMGC